MERYDHKKIEKKWQELWHTANAYRTTEDPNKEKFYILDMFPYPSGAGLHVGHPKGYIATDIISRYKKMQGFNVLHPMGWDAFGLPAEQHALKNKVHPSINTNENIATYKRQLEKIALNYDWERELSTTDQDFYKWTQWAFIQMFKKGLVFESNEPINWCPSCKTGLANEDLEDGKCERCDSEIENKPIRQWVIKITDYADRLLADIDKLDWQESIKESQRNWIGRSEGAEIDFSITGSREKIKVFTTRPDTLFGATYMVLAPEHALVASLADKIENLEEVQVYAKDASKKSHIERGDMTKEKTGVELKGVRAINPANNEEVPIYIADYVLADYGTGAIMAVPAHDERDFDFAKSHNLDIKPVVATAGSVQADWSLEKFADEWNAHYSNYGSLINSSDKFEGMGSEEAKQAITEYVGGKMTTSYKLRDWVFARQRYWGEPIPLIHCGSCGVVPVPESELPVVLPDVESYEPTGTGESPLAGIDEWVNVKCPSCGGDGKRETNTMPQWAGSSWYYLRYIDPKNNDALVDKEKEKYWSPVDFYVGGAEHATRHLIYARFWHKFLFDIGAVAYDEPFNKLQTVGLIMAEDGRKMSKRWGNVVNPDDVIDEYGADAFRTYEMFMGPFDQAVNWSTKGLSGPKRFLDKVWKIQEMITKETPLATDKQLHKTIKKVGEDIHEMKYNTAISEMMILANSVEKEGGIAQADFEEFLKILSPFAPHITQELWHILGNKNLLLDEEWPTYDKDKLVEDTFTLALQVNGKVRAEIEVSIDITKEEVEKLALVHPAVDKWVKSTGNGVVQRCIYITGRLANIVVQ
jgi:leucyl-tRNA synthetase